MADLVGRLHEAIQALRSRAEHSTDQLLACCREAVASDDSKDGLIDSDALDSLLALVRGRDAKLRRTGLAAMLALTKPANGDSASVICRKGDVSIALRRLGVCNVVLPLLESEDADEQDSAAQIIASNSDSCSVPPVREVVVAGHPIRLRQMAFAEVDVAYKVWDSALVLAQHIVSDSSLVEGKEVIELGAGCGLVGIVAARYARRVVTTDYLPRILETLRENVQANARWDGPSDVDVSRRIAVEKLDWMEVEMGRCDVSFGPADVILGADVVYESMHPTMLLATIDAFLKPGGRLVIVGDSYRFGIHDLRAGLEGLGLRGTSYEVAAGHPLVAGIDLRPGQSFLVFEYSKPAS
eukprot:tig00000219_g19447.t1